DDRAYQLAYFAVMMKARQYNRRILNGENTCHVYAIQESNGINRAHLKYFGAGMDDIEKNAAKMQLEGLLDTLTDAKEYGSIVNVESYNWELLRRFVAAEDTDGQISMDSVGVEDTAEQLNRLIDIGETASRKYDIVVTNPPYRAVADCTERLNSFVKANYPDSKNDLSTIFMEKTLSMSKPHGFMAMINIPVWMSKSSFEQLRYKLLALHTFVAVAHCGRGIFGSDFGTVAFVVQNSHIKMYKALFRQLFDELGAVDSVEQKEKWFLEGKGVFYAYPDKFLKIASYPIAYWVSDRLLTILNECKPLTEFAAPRKGLTTGDNDTFARLWFEIELAKFGINGNNRTKWYPMTKGGDFRRWYGNNSYVVNWENDGLEICNFKDEKGKLRSRPQNVSYYFHEGISWNDTTATGKIAFRYQTKEFIPNASGPCVYANKDLWYLFGLLNSKVSQVLLEILAPNMKFEVGQMGLVPIIMENRPEVEELSHNTVRIAKSDWDSFETSWDFKKHPLLRNVSTISEAFNQWNTECDDRFNQLKANEEELNRIFIDIYGLQDELTPEVEDKDVTVRKADLQRDIKSLLSYAVGCMFGRYSLDVEGLAYAGGEWDSSKYQSYIPDADNVIPITDEEYLDDDIVSRLCTWLKAVYSADTLEANLDYIAKALGNKGSTSREIIRNYFLNDFFKDHCQTYSVTGSGKRPIYWLFDSGKQNGFKALVYLHRYTPDTIGNLRIDYLHKMQRVYESEINRMQDMMDHSENAREVAAASKRKDKLAKQLKECREYDGKISHLALSRIELDLDDGVKVNYRKLQTAQDGKFYEVLADSKNIMVKEKK
ncbi:BREX-1 system adenine-specific DNA-methyltransferase PglX, partial [Negativibacillus massiliensis]|uniref:BREX-1 system adenine-specific DNA-methyltransferase PglX n=1 Tax=Negativibacillus massiliensis TaxID=1871035 RepID=UPI002A83D728